MTEQSDVTMTTADVSVSYSLSFSPPCYRLYPVLGKNDFFFEFEKDTYPTIWPSRWKRFWQRLLLGWRWEKV